MAQHDYVIANGTGAAVRSDLNNALSAIVSQNSGATEPATMYAYQWWADTTTGLLKIRNAANNAWIQVGTLASANLGLLSSGGTITAALGSASTPGITFTGDTNTGIYSPGADQVAISTNGSGRLFVDSSGRVLAGTPTARSNFYNTTTVAPRFQLEGSLDTDSRVTSQTYGAASAGGPIYIFAKHRSNSIGGNTVVQSGDYLGEISFQGNDGTEFVEAVTIRAEIDATPGANDMPGRLIFATTKDGQTSPTEAMRIDSQQRVGIGSNAPQHLCQIAGTLAVDSYNDTSKTITLRPGFEANANGGMGLAAKDHSGAAPDGLGIYGTDGVSVHTASAGTFFERFRVDTSGRLLVGTSTSRAVGGANERQLQIEGVSNLGQSIVRNSNDDTGAILALGKSRGTSVNSSTVVQNNDMLGLITFAGADGTDLETQGAHFAAYVDGTPGSNDLPTRLVFSVTRDGSASPTEALRIMNGGGVYTFCSSTSDALNPATAAAAGTSRFLMTGAHSATGVDAGGTLAFRIYTNGNMQNINNSYAGISDVKLKENIVDAGSQWSDLKGLQVRKYNFKKETGHETHTQIGLVAQEAELVSPGLVYETPDRDEDGNDLGTVTKSVNYSVLYMKAVKALQEAMERIEQLESEMVAVKAQFS